MIRARTLLVSTLVILITVLAGAPPADSQSQKAKAADVSGAISGRVTSGGEPVRGVVVYLQAAGSTPAEPPRVTSRTDQNGHFEIKGVPAGTYVVQAFAPALVVAADNPMSGRQGRVVNLSDNETIDAVDLVLQTGGVIAGRVTDVDGRPLIQENVRIFSIGPDNRRQQIYLPFGYMFSTDDRGEYRIFGLPPGKYLASVGVDTSSPVVRPELGSTYRELTFYPDTTDQSKATFIDVSAGSEASGIDIMVGRPTKGYSMSGRIVDATTGKAVVGVPYGYGSYDPQRNILNSSVGGGSTSNARGEFRIDGITPGKYAAFAFTPEDSGTYSDLGGFTITDSDVTGVVVKVHPGATISGNLIVEGADDRPASFRLSDVRLNCVPVTRDAAPRANQVRIAPDGSFRVTGVPRGVTTFSLYYPTPKGITLGRIERDGVDQKDGINVGEGEEISGVKLILAYGTGSIKGQVELEGAEFTPNTYLILSVRRVDSTRPVGIRNPIPDLRGRFFIDGLSTGDYELSLFVNAKPDNGKPGFAKTIKQQVSVTNGNETRVTMLVDLNPTDR